MAEDRDLQRIWHDVNGASERRLREIFAAALPEGSDLVTASLLAAAATDAIRIGLETWAALPEATDVTPGDLALTCYRRLTAWA